MSVNTTGGIEERVATGDAGSIRIDADSLDVLDRSQLSAGIFGPSTGDAGTIEIDLRGRLLMDARAVEGSTRAPGAASYAFIDTGAYHNVGETALGRLPGALGRIAIKAGSAEILDGARIYSECGGCTEAGSRAPDAAEVRIEAGEIRIRNAVVSIANWPQPET